MLEEADAYGDGGTVKRTLTTTTPSAIYTAAQPNVDWGALLGPGDTLDIRIFQRSALIGRGAPKTVTVEVRIVSKIGFEVGAALTKIVAESGDVVEKAQVLARLHASEQLARAARADAAVQAAHATLGHDLIPENWTV